MSKSELERLEADLGRNGELRREVADLLNEPVQLAQWARRHGYDLNPGQVRQLMGSGELSDDDLEQVAGGEDPWTTSGGGSGGTGG